MIVPMADMFNPFSSAPSSDDYRRDAVNMVHVQVPTKTNKEKNQQSEQQETHIEIMLQKKMNDVVKEKELCLNYVIVKHPAIGLWLSR